MGFWPIRASTVWILPNRPLRNEFAGQSIGGVERCMLPVWKIRSLLARGLDHRLTFGDRQGQGFLAVDVEASFIAAIEGSALPVIDGPDDHCVEVVAGDEFAVVVVLATSSALSLRAVLGNILDEAVDRLSRRPASTSQTAASLTPFCFKATWVS